MTMPSHDLCAWHQLLDFSVHTELRQRTRLCRGLPGGQLFGSGVHVGACGEMLPHLDAVEPGLGEPAVGVERIVAQQQERRRLVGLDGGDDGSGCLGRVTRLSAVHGVVFLAAFAGSVGIVIDDGARLHQ